MNTINQGEHDGLERCGGLVEAIGLASRSDIQSVSPVKGGISSDVYAVRLPERTICVKFAARQLRVSAVWRAPLRRSFAEYQWLEFVGRHLPASVPQLLGFDHKRHGFAMTYLPAEAYTNWKDELLGGHIYPAFATAVGNRLATIHALSSNEHAVPGRFDNMRDFTALRLEPYLLHTARRNPDVAPKLKEIALEQSITRKALIHGDVSPKNIFCGIGNPVFIDAECATFGDPAFDVAFCLNHLMIKSVCQPKDRPGLVQAARNLWAEYRRLIVWEQSIDLERRAARLLPALMLARVDGKSRLEYLTEDTADSVRSHALRLLTRTTPAMHRLFDLEES